MALAAIDYSSIASTYNQNFDTLARSQDQNPHAWTNDSTIMGWHLFRITSTSPSYNPAPFAISTYDAGSGTSDAGQFYSFGATDSTDRALGGVGRGTFAGLSGIPFSTVAGWMAASFTNNTGGSLSQFNVGYNGEQWRDAGDNGPPAAQTMVFEYGFGSTFASVSSWTAPGGSFDFISPVFTTTDGPVDGNAAGLVTNRGGMITNLTWTVGDTLWLRWIELNDGGADHGLAIDNVSFSATTAAIPEPGAFLFGAAVCGVVGLAVGGRRLVGKLFAREAA